MRVLVTGSRRWADRQTLDRVLDYIAEQFGHDGLVIVHGNCPTGADAFADQWARRHTSRGVVVERHQADWKHLGAAAGPVRNQAMVNAGADVCVAFIDGQIVGTKDCMTRAKKAGIPIRRFYDADSRPVVGDTLW